MGEWRRGGEGGDADGGGDWRMENGEWGRAMVSSVLLPFMLGVSGSPPMALAVGLPATHFMASHPQGCAINSERHNAMQ